jgi:hypothetical protein
VNKQYCFVWNLYERGWDNSSKFKVENHTNKSWCNVTWDYNERCHTDEYHLVLCEPQRWVSFLTVIIQFIMFNYYYKNPTLSCVNYFAPPWEKLFCTVLSVYLRQGSLPLPMCWCMCWMVNYMELQSVHRLNQTVPGKEFIFDHLCVVCKHLFSLADSPHGDRSRAQYASWTIHEHRSYLSRRSLRTRVLPQPCGERLGTTPSVSKYKMF